MAFANLQTTELVLDGGGTASVAHDTDGDYDWVAVTIEGGSTDFTAAVTFGGQAIAQKASLRGGTSYRGDGRCIVYGRVRSETGGLPAAGSHTFQVVVTGTPPGAKARIWTGKATNPSILFGSDSKSNATCSVTIDRGAYGGIVFMAANAGGSGTSHIHSGIGACTLDISTIIHYSLSVENYGVLARAAVGTGDVTISYFATRSTIVLLGIVEGVALVEPGRVGEQVAWRAPTITAPSDGTVYLTRLGERVAWRPGLRIAATAKRQVALVGEGIETSEMTEGGTEGQVLTQHARRKPTWEDPAGGALALDDLTDVYAPAPADGDVLTWDDYAGEWVAAEGGGGVSDHGGLTGLTDDDHGAYALMVAQTAEPSAPARDEALWYDSDAPAAEPSTPEAAIAVVLVSPAANDKVDVRVPFACRIIRGSLLADQSGSIVVDVWRDAFANYPPTDADSITASAPLTLSSAVASEDSTLTGWTRTLAKGDVLRFNVDSAATVTRVTATLELERT